MTSIVALRYTKPVFKKDQPDDTWKFQPLPQPTGNYPYRLSLDHIVPDVSDRQLVFHMLGDTGSVLHPSFQKLVSNAMTRQYSESSLKEEQPQFLYHLGDLVYHHGEAKEYPRQFFEPYQDYPGPIFAIAGNHDSDVNPDALIPYQSLDAFMDVFCDAVSRPVAFSGTADRQSMIQPNVYWTLKAPLATIIGLHSNVPKYGIIAEEQRNWFLEELRAADQERPGKALIVCLHHAPYSADVNHGSSLAMIKFLETAFEETGIRPDLVFSGHVHNYQRFNKQYPDGKSIPYIVAGAGGFNELNAIAFVDDPQYTDENPCFEGVKLMNYCGDKHGFMKVILKKMKDGLSVTGEYYTIPSEIQAEGESAATLIDRFTFNIT